MNKTILTAMALSVVASFPLKAEVLDSLQEYGNAATEAAATSGAGIDRGFTNPAADTYTITAGGADFWGNSDSGSFLHDSSAPPRSGDFSAVVRMRIGEAGESLASGGWGRTGIMARVDPNAANSANFAHYRRSDGAQPSMLGARNDTGGGTGETVPGRVGHSNGAFMTPHQSTWVWLGLHRQGTTLMSSWAPDNSGAPGAWSAPITREASAETGGPVHIGLAHQNHNTAGGDAPNRNISTAVFEAFNVGPFDASLMRNTILPPPGSLPGPKGETGTFGLLEVRDLPQTGTIQTTVDALTGGAGRFTPNEGQVPILDITDPDSNATGGPVLGGTPMPFLTDTVGSGDDNVKIVAKARLNVTVAGDYTLSFRGDDGFAARIVGQSWTAVEGAGSIDPNDPTTVFFPNGTGDHNTRAVVNLPVGEYDFEYVWWEGGGGAYLEVASQSGDVLGGAPAQWLPLGDPSVLDPLTLPVVQLAAPADIFTLTEGDAGPLNSIPEVRAAFAADPDGTAQNTANLLSITGAGFPNGGGDEFASRATGQIVVDDGDANPGEMLDITLIIRNDDGGQLRIIGQDFIGVAGNAAAVLEEVDGDMVLVADYFTGDTNALGHLTLAEGTYDFEALMFEGGGGERLEIRGALGHQTAHNGEFATLEASPATTTLPANVGIGLVAPEAELYDGPTVSDPLIADGEVNPIDFGITRPGVALIRSFSMENTGSGNLTVSGLSSTDPAYTLVAPISSPIPPGGSTTFEVAFDSSVADGHPATLSVHSDDCDEMSYDFAVTGIIDDEAPVITTPPTIRVTAPPGETSVAVFYDASAADNYDPEPTLVCVPESGSVFDWGTTVVTCTATDSVGNESVATFLVCVSLPGDVLVLGPTIGEAAPGEAGGERSEGGPSAGTFTSIVGAHLAGAGKLLVEADADSVRGLWAGDVGALGQVALTGSTTAADGAVLSGIDRYSINEWGDVTLRGRDAIGDAGNWLGDAGSAVAGIGFVGEAAPDTAGSFSEVSLGGWALNNTGEQFALAFIGKDPGLGIDDSNNSGIWSSDDGLVLREGDPVAAVPGGTHGKFGNQIAANDAGWLAFDSAIVGVGGANRGVFSGPAANPGLVARRDDPAPGIPGATLERFLGVAQNAAGEVAFPAQVIGAVTPHDNDGLWTNAGGPLQLVAREGDEVPGSEGTLLFDSFFDIYVTDAVDGELFGAVNAVIFAAQLRGADIALSASEDTAFFAYVPQLDLLAPIAFEGDIAPGTSGVFRSLTALNVHDGGDLAFNGILVRGVGGVTRADDHGVWCASPDSEVALLIRSGETFVDATETEQTIRRVFISDTHDNGTAGRSGPVSCGNVAVIATYLNNRASSVLVLGKPGAPQEGGGEIVVTQDGGS